MILTTILLAGCKDKENPSVTITKEIQSSDYTSAAGAALAIAASGGKPRITAHEILANLSENKEKLTAEAVAEANQQLDAICSGQGRTVVLSEPVIEERIRGRHGLESTEIIVEASGQCVIK